MRSPPLLWAVDHKRSHAVEELPHHDHSGTRRVNRRGHNEDDAEKNRHQKKRTGDPGPPKGLRCTGAWGLVVGVGVAPEVPGSVAPGMAAPPVRPEPSPPGVVVGGRPGVGAPSGGLSFVGAAPGPGFDQIEPGPCAVKPGEPVAPVDGAPVPVVVVGIGVVAGGAVVAGAGAGTAY